jgi:hypothetical protein
MKNFTIPVERQNLLSVVQILRRHKDVTVNNLKEERIAITIESDHPDDFYKDLINEIGDEIDLSESQLKNNKDKRANRKHTE